ncbi:MAG: tRNA lysidine(34) synthetase TilS [SAR86 cluster bacterium]|uniref:tRNA(Ile)-lysidine synthase n=1 Tax=SAR86 cluster bacterium TaxID=2030880 RepID=A0A2A4XC77_9GAMM|nr:MAG: tRNA lysidine(34) synthetase TilS [SAR86 cluster bacterium]
MDQYIALLCPQAMNYSPQLLHDKLAVALNELASTHKFLIGLSGGLDSVVLLHAMAKLRDQPGTNFQLRALHINHQLQDQAQSWEQYCLSLCARLDVECTSTKVEIAGSSGIENSAREARYHEFEAALLHDEELLLAHHRDDQMETLLLRLIRGSGTRGLSGIPRNRMLGASRLLRPLLDIDREELQSYAESEQLIWVEDHSNKDEGFDRNYCRHSLLPLIEARWPGYRESWSKSAVLASESEVLIQELAAIDLAESVAESESVVSREKLLALSEPRRRNVLRHWLAGLGAKELGWNQLQQLSNEVLLGTSGQFIAEDFQIFCFRERVYVLASQELERDLEKIDLGILPGSPVAREVMLPGNGRLRFGETQGGGICLDKLSNLSVRYRQGGETCRLAGRPSKTLKKILQESEIPPWLRGRIPLLYDGEDLAYIPGLGVSEGLAAQGSESGCIIEWEQPDLTLLA